MTESLAPVQKELLQRIEPFIGKSTSELFECFKIRPGKRGRYSKNALHQVIDRLLDVKTIAKERNVKTQGISIKTVRVSKQKSLKEPMSFPTFEFKKIVAEQWETSTLRKMFENTTYLFVIFQQIRADEYRFRGVKFWKMPAEDLEGPVRQAWLQTVKILNQGVQLTYDSERRIVNNNLLLGSAEMIVHVRPHATKSSYCANSQYASQLPVNAKWVNKPEEFALDWMTKQSFWLNKDYLLHQIEDLL